MTTEIADHDQHPSPRAPGDDGAGNGALGAGEPSRGTKRPRPSAAADDDDDDDDKPGRERRKIEIKFIQDKSRRHITFSKRKAGIMKKAYELSVLTGTQVLLLVVSETGLVYTFTTPKLQPLVTKPEGKNLIQACLNAPEPASDGANGVDDGGPVDSPDDATNPAAAAHAQASSSAAAAAQAQAVANASQRGGGPGGQGGMPGGGGGGMPPGGYMTAEQALQYQTYLQQQNNVAAQGHYQMPPQGRMGAHPQHQ